MTALTHKQKLRRNKIAFKLQRRTGRGLNECLREATAVVQGRKPRPGKRRDAFIREVVKQATARAITEALNCVQAPSRPVTELTGGELAGRLAEAYAA